jgi:hypothetical protein
VTTGNSPGLLEQTRAFNAELERLIATVPAVNTIPPEESRRARREGLGIFPKPVFAPEARWLEIDGPAGPMPLRVIAPEQQPTGVFLHFHGVVGRSARATSRTAGCSALRATPG